MAAGQTIHNLKMKLTNKNQTRSESVFNGDFLMRTVQQVCILFKNSYLITLEIILRLTFPQLGDYSIYTLEIRRHI